MNGEPGQQNGGTQVVHGRFLGPNLGYGFAPKPGSAFARKMLGRSWPVARGRFLVPHGGSLSPRGGGDLEGKGGGKTGQGAPPAGPQRPPPPAAHRAPPPARLRPAARAPAAAERPPESGRRSGEPDPVRYGDWEVKGIATDF